MELSDKVTQLEDEIKVLKNEVQAVLLDLRDSYLNRENPFSPAASPISVQPIVINQQPSQPPPNAEEKADDVISGEEQENEPLEVEALADEPEPVYEPELTASEETAREEVTRVWRPEIEPEARFKSGKTTDGPGGKVDLATIARLSQWVAEAVKQLGSERTEAILDISEMMGHMAPELKAILVKFISPTPGGYSGRVTTRDYLASLIELEGLLGKDNKSEVALLYILCQENDHR
jgi:hypothetical protein